MRILVVDDCADTTSSLSQLLQLWGFDSRAALDGPSALTLAENYHPEVILLDAQMPGMSGYEVAQKIRSGGYDGVDRPLLVCLSGWTREEDRATALKAGFDFHIGKPPDLELLHQLMRACALHLEADGAR